GQALFCSSPVSYISVRCSLRGRREGEEQLACQREGQPATVAITGQLLVTWGNAPRAGDPPEGEGRRAFGTKCKPRAVKRAPHMFPTPLYSGERGRGEGACVPPLPPTPLPRVQGRGKSPHATRITRTSITLVCVSPVFSRPPAFSRKG